MNGADNTEELIEVLNGIKGRRYAVVDAAHFDNLQELLNAAGLPFHPLYLDEKDPAPGAEIAGPHLVELPTPSSARKLISLAHGKPAIVWWVWPENGEGTAAEIYRHLRRLNVIEIPSDRFDADEHPAAASDTGLIDHVDHGHEHAPQPPKTESYDLVIFRHADPNVIAMLLPLLDATQVSRLFGDAMGIVVVAQEFDGVREFPRPLSLPPKLGGRLKIKPKQYDGLAPVMDHRSRIRIAAYLRDVAELQTKDFDDSALMQVVHQAEQTGNEMGIASERGLALWAFLIVLTGGAALSSPEVRNRLSSSDNDPDDEIEALVGEIAEADEADLEALV